MVCKICDKKDSFSTLGHAPPLCIKDSICDTPSVSQIVVSIRPSLFLRRRHLGGRFFNTDDGFEDCLEVLSLVGGEGTRHILPHDKSWFCSIGLTPHFFHDSDCFIEQAGP